MANKGYVRLGILDVEGKPARDPRVDAVLFGGTSPRRELKKFKKLTYPPQSHKLVVPAYPDEFVISFDIMPTRFRAFSSGVLSVTNGETVDCKRKVFRKPESWTSRFVGWNYLPAAFSSLKRVLRDSTDVVLKAGDAIGRFTEGIYDQASDPALRLAKAGLLNLFTKLTRMIAPDTNRSWFSFVKEILVIDRECFVDIGSYEYNNAGAGNHHGNLPVRFNVPKSKMYSIKSDVRKGNIQLTIGPGTDPTTGEPVFLLDADIDESGDLFGHLVDIFKHKFSGGTHPFDIREFLLLEKPGANVGYTLV